MPSDKGKRARFKKGQKVIIAQSYPSEDGGLELTYHLGQITRGEKYTDPETHQATFYYDVHIPDYNKGAEARFEENELMKYDVNLLTGDVSAEADAARARALEAAEAKQQMERQTIVPPQLRLTIPPSLKQMILDDHDLITHQGRILPLPRSNHSKPSVAQLIRDWQEFRKLEEPEALCLQIDEISDKLIEYFDLSLRQFLLFQPEVAACDLALESTGLVPSQMYGAEHLVRLIVKLPDLVPVVLMSTPGNAQFIIIVEDEIGDLLAWATEETRTGNLFSTKEDYIANPHWTPPPVIAATGPGTLITPGSKSKKRKAGSQEETGEEKAMEVEEEGEEEEEQPEPAE